MIDVLSYVKGRRKTTSGGWISFNAVCCQNNGHSQDKRGRGGFKINEQGWSYHCFNCNYTASFILGRSLSFKARRLLQWLGVADDEIERENLLSLKHRNMLGVLDDRQRLYNTLQDIQFEERELPPGAELITQEHTAEWQYIRQRQVPEDFPMMTVKVNDGVHWTRPMVVIPFTYDNAIVGYTCRFLDRKIPKYISQAQTGYVFGMDLQRAHWQYAIVVEGVFDALSINGLAVMHSTVSEPQARLIRSLGREVIVVPDRDAAGLELIDRAMELGWAVSIPDWPADVKDVNDAVCRYGRLATLLRIIQSKETSKIKIEMRKKQLLKQVGQ